MARKIRLNLALSKDLDDAVKEIASDAGVSKGEVFRQAIALLKAAHDAKTDRGVDLAFTKDGQSVETKIVGVL